MITIAETPPYTRKAEKLLSSSERRDLISYLARNPKSGALIEGTGGVRKLRWSRSASGKRGGVRIIYYYHSELMPLYLLTLFAKNEKENISKQEKNILTLLVKELAAFWRLK